MKGNQDNSYEPLELWDSLNVLYYAHANYLNNQVFTCGYHCSPHIRDTWTLQGSDGTKVLSSSNHTDTRYILTTCLLEHCYINIITMATTNSFGVTLFSKAMKSS